MTDLFLCRTQDTGGTDHLRLKLTQVWDHGLPFMLSCGANPSHADSERDDMTIGRVRNFARRWGYGGFIKVNIEPFRSPSPAECQAWIYGHAKDAEAGRAMNRQAITEAAAACEFHLVCWGNLAIDKAWAYEVCKIIAGDADRPLHCLGLTNGGNPTHPMARGKHRVPDDAVPEIYDWRRHLAAPAPSPIATDQRSV